MAPQKQIEKQYADRPGRGFVSDLKGKIEDIVSERIARRSSEV
jgi:hypothetical protein